MVSGRLTELGEAGLVMREVQLGPPTVVEYELTPSGRELIPILSQLAIGR